MHFVVAGLSLLAGGSLMLFEGAVILESHWRPQTLTLVHLGTLGFLGSVMVGALYQMIPVLAGRAVPLVRSSWLWLLLLVCGLVTLLLAAKELPPGYFVSFSFLTAALFACVLLFGWALLRSRAQGPSVIGLRFAIFALFLTLMAGAWMSHGFGPYAFPGDRGAWIQGHLSIAWIGWIGCLITAVSWQVVPMFYLAPEPSRRSQWLTLVGIMLGALLPFLALMAGKAGFLVLPQMRSLAFYGSIPGLLALGVFHPWLCLRTLRARRRRRVDVSFVFWRFGLLIAPLSVVVALLTWFGVPRCELLLGWLVLFAWAGGIVHGMLARIIPFLFWFHRCSPLVGRVMVPTLRQLLPDAHVRRGFWLHLATSLLGAMAWIWPIDLLAWATGLGVFAVGLTLLSYVLRCHRVPIPEAPPSDVSFGQAFPPQAPLSS
ncbi:MAG: hypothetical protein CSA62_07555 [Planctomycetota bacterium]|nr:MAG: hypothetical protein CSA62_07555 [Planctomycetota bacterium]